MSTEQNVQSDLVYHHTDHGAVAGILSKQTFRFSHIDYLNDSAERTYVHKYVEQYVEQKKERYRNDPDVLHLLDVMLDENRSAAHMSSKSSAQYIACFTVSRNELSQWRGYSRGVVPSYAITFKRDAFVAATKKILETEQIGSVLWKNVTYIGPNKDRVSDLIESRIAKMKEKQRRGDPNLRYEASHIGDLAHSFFSQNRPTFFKHHAFRQEAEFRIAISLWNVPPPRSAVRFDVMPAAAAMKPYIDLTYGIDVMRSLIDRMIVGPTPENGLACRALEQYRASLGYDFPVEYCDIPFRPGW